MCLLMKLEIFSSIFNAFNIYNFRILIMWYGLFILITAKQGWECYNSWVLGPDSSIFNHLHDPTSLHTYPQIVSPHIFFFLSSPVIIGKGIPKEYFFVTSRSLCIPDVFICYTSLWTTLQGFGFGSREIAKETSRSSSRKKYFLVLDEVWYDEPDKWEMLKSILFYGAKGSSKLVTTYLSGVAILTLSQIFFWIRSILCK